MRIIPPSGKYEGYLVFGILLAFFLVSLALRGIPAFFIPQGGFIPVYDSDTWYTLRQIEVMAHSFPLYNWFEPMTAYPTGKLIDWGPLLPALASSLALITGVTTRATLVNTAMWIGPILGACLVPVLYLLGKVLHDRTVGIVAAALASFVSFRLFFLSSYGFVDHHVAEALTTSLFLLAYGTALVFMREHPFSLSRPQSLLQPLALSLLCGVFYFAGLITSTTVVILLMVTGIYTVIQICADSLEGRPVRDYLLLNTGTGLTALLLLLAFGIKADGFSLGRYSAGQLLACAGFIGLALAFALISLGARGRNRLFLALCLAFAAAAYLALQMVPLLMPMGDQVLQFFSLSGASSVSIQEMHPWSPEVAWQNFNLFLLLGAGGFVILGLRIVRRRRREELLLGVWALSLLAVTLLHSRFEYYLAVPLILLSALCIVETARAGLPGIVSGVLNRFRDPTPARDRGNPVPRTPRGASGKKGRPGKVSKTAGKEAEKREGRWPGRAGIVSAIVLVIFVAGSGLSLSMDILSGLQVPYREIHGDWVETLGWMDAHTPSPGVDYLGPYNPRTFSYPPGSYGVMATWEAGHWITFFARRIPNVNPFQDNLPGDSGGAAFLLAPSEGEADRILDLMGTRFVITDAWTATDTFAAQIPWVDPSLNLTPYIRYFFRPDPESPTQLGLVRFFDQAYYRSMVVRLQNLDGSMVVPGQVQYIEYSVRNVPGPGETAPVSAVGPVISRIEERDALSAARDAASLNSNPLRAESAVVLSDRPDSPPEKIPAVSHLRLVHESPGHVSWDLSSGLSVGTNVSYVKVFEYVRGAHIRGNGTIELSLVTNTGRPFTYRQESHGGEFIVPYSTLGNPYEVRATGPYRIVGSTATYEVSEEDIHSGQIMGP
jgi:dolichyl-diphosphooligosaccharide--protein glycosyltransferase